MLFVATFARTSRAHDPFEVTSVARLTPDALIVEVTMARSTALRLTTGRHGGRASFAPEEFSTHRARLEEIAPSFYEITSNGRTLASRAASAKLTEENDVEIVTEYERPSGARLSLRARHLSTLPEGYTTAVSVASGGPETRRSKLLTAADPVFEVPLATADEVRNVVPVPEASPWARFKQFAVLGVEHVLTGYDHLLFLIGVLIACRTVRSMLAVVTTFTGAHSLTLALAVLGQVSVPGRIVEPLIAASIVFVGVENVLGQEALRRRVAITFVFGLVHGLGFADALTRLDLERSALPVTLFSFNLGVELGQLAVAALVMPLLTKLHSIERGIRGLRFSSALLSVAGCFWFVQRLVLGR